MSEVLQIRVHGDASLPTLIYLPGLHGDWTLVRGFRHALGNRVRFVEITYPRTLTWSLDDYAAGVEAGLKEHGIMRGWILAESFSSQVAWPLVARKQFDIEGIILIGGFVRHPFQRWLRIAEVLTGGLFLSLLTRIIFLGANKTFLKLYGWIVQRRYRGSPEMLSSVDDFLARRTPLDLKAAKHRLHLLAGSDFRDAARRVQVPIFGLTGSFDPIVPWRSVRRWLQRDCPALREYRVLGGVDHMVLGSGTKPAAEQVLRWMEESATASKRPLPVEPALRGGPSMPNEK